MKWVFLKFTTINIMDSVKKYYQLCGIRAPRHIVNMLTKEELNAMLTEKKQKIFLKPGAQLSINESVVGAKD